MKDDSTSRKQQLARVAWMYYQDDMTQAEIAEKLGLSRVTVNRMIKEARDSGVVEIRVRTDQAGAYALASRICERYGLRDAVVATVSSEDENLQSLLAAGAAEVLAQRLQAGMTVGIGTGRTISYLPDHFQPEQPIACRFISLTGGLDMQSTGVPHTYDTITRMAIKTGGEAVYIPAPSYLTDPAAQRIFLEEPAVIAALQTAAGCQMAFFSIGATDYSAILFQLRCITEEDMKAMKKARAVGDLLGRFFNQEGRQIPLDLNIRLVGLEIETVKQIPVKVLVAGGENKREALRVALQHGFCDILVTDEYTAGWLLAGFEQSIEKIHI